MLLRFNNENEIIVHEQYVVNINDSLKKVYKCLGTSMYFCKYEVKCATVDLYTFNDMNIFIIEQKGRLRI